jgi:hypothetical protein
VRQTPIKCQLTPADTSDLMKFEQSPSFLLVEGDRADDDQPLY